LDVAPQDDPEVRSLEIENIATFTVFHILLYC